MTASPSHRIGHARTAVAAYLTRHQKICQSSVSQHITELALEAAGPYGHAFQPQAGFPGGPNVIPHDTNQFAGPRSAAIAPLKYFNDRAGSIYAGSNEIQRNIIAKAGLGL